MKFHFKINYSITNKINNKIYIGQSIHCYERFKQHRNSLKKCGAIYRAFEKYGIENFKFDILEECDRDQLDNLESYYIKLFNTISLEYRYSNLNSGGNANKIISEETRKKMSEGQLGKKYGKKISNETKEKIRQANIGRILTDEWREKIRQSNIGKIQSEESKEKNRLSHLGKKLSNKIRNERLYSNIVKIRKLMYNKLGDGYFTIDNKRIQYNYKNSYKSFSFNTHGYVKSIQKAFDLKFLNNNYFSKLKNFHFNKITEENNKYKNTYGYISIQKTLLYFRYSENGKEHTKSFSILKYGYVKAMKNCLDLMFKKNDYFNKRIKVLNQNFFIL